MRPDDIIDVVMIEDDEGDAAYVEEILAELEQRPLRVEWARSFEQGVAAIERVRPAAVLLDLGLPDSIGPETLHRLIKAAPDVPTIVLTGLDDMEAALETLQDGAQDYLVKGRFDAQLLVRSVRYAIERHKLLRSLHDALAEVKQLSGILPICSYCKKVRDDKGYWSQVEAYIQSHSEARFSHGMCPECEDREMAKIDRMDG